MSRPVRPANSLFKMPTRRPVPQKHEKHTTNTSAGTSTSQTVQSVKKIPLKRIYTSGSVVVGKFDSLPHKVANNNHSLEPDFNLFQGGAIMQVQPSQADASNCSLTLRDGSSQLRYNGVKDTLKSRYAVIVKRRDEQGQEYYGLSLVDDVYTFHKTSANPTTVSLDESESRMRDIELSTGRRNFVSKLLKSGASKKFGRDLPIHQDPEDNMDEEDRNAQIEAGAREGYREAFYASERERLGVGQRRKGDRDSHGQDRLDEDELRAEENNEDMDMLESNQDEVGIDFDERFDDDEGEEIQEDFDRGRLEEDLAEESEEENEENDEEEDSKQTGDHLLKEIAAHAQQKTISVTPSAKSKTKQAKAINASQKATTITPKSLAKPTSIENSNIPSASLHGFSSSASTPLLQQQAQHIEADKISGANSIAQGVGRGMKRPRTADETNTNVISTTTAAAPKAARIDPIQEFRKDARQLLVSHNGRVDKKRISKFVKKKMKSHGNQFKDAFLDVIGSMTIRQTDKQNSVFYVLRQQYWNA